MICLFSSTGQIQRQTLEIEACAVAVGFQCRSRLAFDNQGGVYDLRCSGFLQWQPTTAAMALYAWCYVTATDIGGWSVRKARNAACLWRQGAGAALRPVPMKHVWGCWLECVGHVTEWRPGQLARWKGHVLRALQRCEAILASAHCEGTEARPATWQRWPFSRMPERGVGRGRGLAVYRLWQENAPDHPRDRRPTRHRTAPGVAGRKLHACPLMRGRGPLQIWTRRSAARGEASPRLPPSKRARVTVCSTLADWCQYRAR